MMPSFPSVSFLMTLMLAAAVCAQEKQVVREVVKDTAGNAVRTNEQYFIQPVNTLSNGGGLIPLPVKVPLCPLGINQVLRRDVPGLPVSFGLPWPYKDTDVYTMELVNIELKPSSDNVWPVCKGFSNLWTVDGSSSASDEPPILVGGKQLEHFKIEREEHFVGGNVYKFTTTFDGIIGTVQGPLLGLPQLVLTNDTAKTLLVKFIKVENATTTSRAGKLALRMFPLY